MNLIAKTTQSESKTIRTPGEHIISTGRCGRRKGNVKSHSRQKARLNPNHQPRENRVTKKKNQRGKKPAGEQEARLP